MCSRKRSGTHGREEGPEVRESRGGLGNGVARTESVEVLAGGQVDMTPRRPRESWLGGATLF